MFFGTAKVRNFRETCKNRRRYFYYQELKNLRIIFSAGKENCKEFEMFTSHLKNSLIHLLEE